MGTTIVVIKGDTRSLDYSSYTIPIDVSYLYNRPRATHDARNAERIELPFHPQIIRLLSIELPQSP